MKLAWDLVIAWLWCQCCVPAFDGFLVMGEESLSRKNPVALGSNEASCWQLLSSGRRGKRFWTLFPKVALVSKIN